MSIEILSAFGLGAIFTAIFQAFFNLYQNKKALSFQEKKEAYIGYLNAMHQSEVCRDEQSALNVGHWQNRIELVGSKSVVKSCHRIGETNPQSGEVHPDRPQALLELKEQMRRDLGVS